MTFRVEFGSPGKMAGFSTAAGPLRGAALAKICSRHDGEMNVDRPYAAPTSLTPALSLTMVLLSSMTQA